MALILQAVACAEDSGEPVAEPAGEPRFEEVAVEAGIDYSGPSSGLAVGDFDGDGWEDLFSSNHGSPVALYRNLGGRYVDASELLLGLERGDTHGAAWGDFDNDGDQDLIQLVGAQRGEGRGENRLYVNRGGRLEQARDGLGVADPFGRGRIPLWLDWDRDGRLDLLINNAPRRGAPSRLLLGRRHGFVPPPEPPWEPFGSLQAGLLWHHGERALLVAGSGGRLRLIGSPSAADGVRTILPVASDWASADFDADGHGDLVVVRGSGGPSFELVEELRLTAHLPVEGEERGVELVSAGAIRLVLEPAAPRWWQPEDVFVGANGAHPGAMVLELDPVAAGGYPEGGEGRDKWVRIGHDPESSTWTIEVGATEREVLNVLVESEAPITEIRPVGFRATEAGGWARYLAGPDFEDRTSTAGLGPVRACLALVSGDFDNDADLNLYLACSEAGRNPPNRLLLNDGSGRFEEVDEAGGAAGAVDGAGEGVVTTDFDGDGRLDLVVVNGAGLRPFNDGPLELFRNRTAPGGWIEAVLHGRISTADGVGARLVLRTDGGSQTRLRGDEIGAGGQSRPTVHFGLGEAVVRALEIDWPSGRRQRFVGLPKDRRFHLVETASPPERPQEPVPAGEAGE